MQQNEKQSFNYYMRALHRDVGFFVVGLALVYSLSGVVLLYRDTDFLMRDVQVERTLPAGLDSNELAKALHLRGFKVSTTEDDVVHFREGTYNRITGLAAYSKRELPYVLQKFVDLHKTASGKTTHWYAILFGVLLCFLAVSSFWMYRKGTGPFRRGLWIAAAGVVITAIVLFL